ncbi:MAG: hypothetical protein ACI4Q9_00720 [Candidatus Methanomethylophilaceae archaeon]
MSKSKSKRPRNVGSVARGAIDGATGIGSNSFYDCKSGVFIASVLAMALSWIPHLGLMVAGFVGGRRAGSMSRGVLVGLASSVAVLSVALVLNIGFAKLFTPEYQSVIDGISAVSPQIVAAMESVNEYLTVNFVSVEAGNVSVPFGKYALLTAFSLIGGVLADQARKEVRIIVSHAEERARPKAPRSVRAHMESRPMGFRTFDDLSRMNVNAVAPSQEPKAQKQVPVQDAPKVQQSVPAPAPVAPPKVEVTSTTVTPSEVVLTPTESGTISVKLPEQDVTGEPKDTQKEKRSSADDLDWF